MKKIKYITITATLLITTCYQNAPAQIYNNSALNSLSIGRLSAYRGSSTISGFTHYSTGSDHFRQTLNRQPNPLAARLSVNRLKPQTTQTTGFTRRTSALSRNRYINSATSSIFSPAGTPSTMTSLNAASTNLYNRPYSQNPTLFANQTSRIFARSSQTIRSLSNYPSIFNNNTRQNAMSPSLLNQTGLLSPNNRNLFSFQSNTMANRRAQSEYENTRLSPINSFFRGSQSSPFLRVRRY